MRSEIVNYLSFLPHWQNKLDTYTIRLPYRYRTYFRNRYLQKIQDGYLAAVNAEKPDFVLIYNDQMVTAELAREIKKTSCKLAVYLADSPFFLVNRDHIFRMLFEVDHIFASDTYWLQQVETLGLKNTTFLIPGYDPTKYFPKTPTAEEPEKYSSDLFYLGSTYANIWNYKRALFLSKFADLDIRIYGPRAWQRWFTEFPELEQKFVPKEGWLSEDLVNTIANCCKLYPVDANPGLINGLHIRIFDCIGSGILPLVEYRRDIERVFKDIEIPIIHNYDQALDLVKYYLNNENKRMTVIKRLKEHIDSNFQPVQAANIVLNKIFDNNNEK